MIIRCPDCGVIRDVDAKIHPHEQGCSQRNIIKPTIRVMDREHVSHFVHDHPFAVISIHTPGQAPPEISCTQILRICFHDLDNPDYNIPLFSKEQAQQIWSFVDALNDIDLLVIHCDAGISRSPAVAAAICYARGENDQGWFRRYMPNKHVYSTMLKVRFDEPT